MENNNNRKHKRYSKDLYVAVKLLNGEIVLDDQPFGLLIELSRGGGLLKMTKTVTVDSTLSIRIGLGEHIEEFNGTVVHIRQEGNSHLAGIRFTDLTQSKETLLDQVTTGTDISPLGEWF